MTAYDDIVVGAGSAGAVVAGRLSDVAGAELHPGYGVRTRPELEAEIHRHGEHTFHPACTARIGTETDGVVTPAASSGSCGAACRRRPRIPHGNTHAPAVMVGEKAAEMLRGCARRDEQDPRASARTL